MTIRFLGLRRFFMLGFMMFALLSGQNAYSQWTKPTPPKGGGGGGGGGGGQSCPVNSNYDNCRDGCTASGKSCHDGCGDINANNALCNTGCQTLYNDCIAGGSSGNTCTLQLGACISACQLDNAGRAACHASCATGTSACFLACADPTGCLRKIPGLIKEVKSAK